MMIWYYHDTHIQIYYEVLTKSMKEQPKQYEDDMVHIYYELFTKETKTLYLWSQQGNLKPIDLLETKSFQTIIHK